MSDTIEITYGTVKGLPANFREVDEAEFVKNAMRRIYTPQRIEYRQFHALRKDHPELPGDLQLHWYHNGKGDATYLDYWAGKVRFFLFAECEHEMKHTRNLGRCFNEYTCSKCGYVEQIDSGD
jgi:hypothetical protein